MTDSLTVALPPELAVRNVLADVLDRDVSVTHAGCPAVEDGTGLLAVYRDDDQQVRAVAGWSAPLVLAAGGALGLVPAGLVTEFIEEGFVRPDLLENVLEMCNVLVAAFGRGETTPHLRFAGHHHPASGADSDLRALATRHGNRLDLVIGIAGYPDGVLTLAVV